MIIRSSRSQRRSAATTVEFAVVASILFLFLFGIFEYARYLFVHHVTNNAAHDAARFAAAHTGGPTMPGDPATINEASIISVFYNGTAPGSSTVYGRGMFGMEHNISGIQVNAFAVPDGDLYSATPNLSPTGKPAWNTARFGQKICVRVSGQYQPVLPSFLGFGTGSFPIVVNVMMGSEGN